MNVTTSRQSRSWPPLESVPRELDQLAVALREAGFRVDRTIDPTGQQLRSTIEEFIGKHGYQRGNRLLFFFSGHGYTMDEGQRGYFVPSDTPDPAVDEIGFRRVAVSMQQVSTWARELTARHALFAFDSCFSGTIFATGQKFDVVMAWSVDRLGRSLQDLVAFLSELHALGIDLFLHQQGLDTTNAGR